MGYAEKLVIVDTASLQAWRRELRDLVRLRGLAAVEFRLPGVDPDRNRSWSALADGYRGACGCASSGFMMTIVAVATVASHFLAGNRLRDVGLRQILTLVAITVVAALAGKLAGLLWARGRLLALAATAQRAIAPAIAQARTNQMG
jgi:hypothetical protein